MRTLGRLFKLTAICAALQGPVAHAHMDRLIPWAPDGSLTRLPPEYSPAALKVVRARGKPVQVRLTLGRNTTELPACLAGWFSDEARARTEVSASWYHDSGGLPPYLSVDVYRHIGVAVGDFPVQDVLFNLDTARIIDVNHMRFRPGLAPHHWEPLTDAEICSNAARRP